MSKFLIRCCFGPLWGADCTPQLWLGNLKDWASSCTVKCGGNYSTFKWSWRNSNSPNWPAKILLDVTSNPQREGLMRIGLRAGSRTTPERGQLQCTSVSPFRLLGFFFRNYAEYSAPPPTSVSLDNSPGADWCQPGDRRTVTMKRLGVMRYYQEINCL